RFHVPSLVTTTSMQTKTRKNWLILVLALFLGAAAAVGASRYLSQRMAEIEARGKDSDTVRLVVAKTNLAGGATLSPDTVAVREVPRALRRAGMPVWYSQGFHPKPVMTFGPALSLGVPSFCEYVDVKFSEPVDPKDLVRALAGCTPDGLRFLEAQVLEPGADAIGAVVRTAHYVIGFPTSMSRELQEKLIPQTGRKHALEGVTIVRQTDTGPRSLELGELIAELGPGEEGDEELMASAGVAGTWWPARVAVRITPTATVRLQEIAAALTGLEDVEFRAVRVKLGE
ncbi:MAG TPA: TIGR03936 family radical SAM-associated protein, partial [Polyangiaceae bacterium]|nr:TIGR03936 family radical SAM-associated protein [Polyangiaceae bacterium]